MAVPTRFLWPAVAVAIGAIALGLYWGGYLARLDNGIADARARLLAHEIATDIVIVGIDSESLRALSEWPWPRRHHARLLQHLNQAAPASVFLDIDFSSRSNAADDALLEKALAEWRWDPVLLATHIQKFVDQGGPAIVANPLEEFAQHARLASVMLEQSPDGLVRAMPGSWEINDERLRSVFAYDSAAPDVGTVKIDFSILPSSFAYVPYSRLLNGEIDVTSLRGKRIYVGATAVELGDTVPVPVHGWLPGVVLQALAAETLRVGPLSTPAPWTYASVLLAWMLACWVALWSERWRRNLLYFGAGIALLAAATLYLYAVHRVALDVAAFAGGLAIVFVVSTLRSLDTQTWRALALAVGFRRRDALLKSVVESTTDSIMCVDASGVIRTANPAAAALFVCEPAALLGSRLDTFIPDIAPQRRGSIDTLTHALLECTAVAAGHALPVEVSIGKIALDDAEERLFTVIVRDVSERVAQQRKLAHQATHDALTGLPNRLALSTHLHTALTRAAPRRHVALLLLDLGHFKEVNDTLGHDVGDHVLTEVAGRFSTAVGDRGMLGRIGGDEFTVVLSDVTDRATIDTLARALIESLTVPIHVQGIALEIGVSVGIAVAPDHAHDAKGLLRNADIAMYAAKSNGTPCEYYDRNRDMHTVRRLTMMGELRAAIDENQLTLFFQPQVDLQSGEAQSVEALVRWNHPMLGNVRPDEFITLAESTNLIRPLTDWTIYTAIRQANEWRKQGLDLRVAVNLSPRLLQDVAFPNLLKRILEESEIDPSRFELEITENAMMLDPARGMRIIKQLHALGVLISIDDYGTGFSSLGYLRDLPAHALKLDKSFVLDLETNESNRVIVESTLHMAHALGLQIIAEGVESSWAAEHLRRMGYDFAQGYWFARPMPAEECLEWVRQFNAQPERRVG